MEFVLITPARNEIESIEQLVADVKRQTARPLLWVIVDGRSSDGTYETVKDLSESDHWIHVIAQDKFFAEGYSHLNFAQAVNEGYQHARMIATTQGLDYRFVGKTDATPRLSPRFFELLLEEITSDDNIAVVSGVEHRIRKGELFEVGCLPRLSFSGYSDLRLYRREFFEGMGGYPMAPSPDVVLLIKARSKGFATSLKRGAWFIEPRLGGTKVGKWNGYVIKGRTMYQLGYKLRNVFVSSIYYSVRFFPHQQGSALLFGYLASAVEGEKKVDDVDVLSFFGQERLGETIECILETLKKGI